MVTVSLYARVSSGKQAQENTIASQVAALEKQISTDGYKLLSEYKFIDNGYSGSNLVRPDLEKLRDKVTEGKIDRIYLHSPDRLSRKYAYQMVLLEEFEKAGAETVFLNYEINDNPESQLLLQMQGMIAEYERAKIMERSRRGKIYAANKGCVSVMGGAPYGYRYIDKYMGGGQALFEINEEEANVVRKVFLWIGRERTSIGEVCRRLNTMSIITRTGKKYWDRSVIWGMLKNPAYKGQAAFGKTKVGIKLQHIRPQKHSCEQPKDNYSTYSVEKANWIYVKVPNIVDEDVFDIVQEQLAENRKIARTRERGAKYLLQGLIVCKRCRYAYYGSPVRNKRGEKIDHYAYYRCIGRDSYRFGGNKICDNKHIRTDALETAVWEEVKHLLKNPNRVLEEYRRRLSELKKSSWDQKSDLLEKQENKLKRGIARLIDSYAQEYINQEEFEPRIKAMKQSLKTIEEEKKRIFDQKKLKQELTLVVTNLEDFSSNITSNLDNADWLTKRDIIRTLVKRIEINLEDVNVVFRVKELPNSPGNNREEKKNLQHCWRGKVSTIWGYQSEGFFPRFSAGEFYPIYNIENGVLVEHSPPPQANIVTTALARYDKEANGSYVVNGLEVMFLQREEGEGQKRQVFVINEGKAHVDGYEIELPHSIRVYFDEDPDIKTVKSEFHTFQPNSQRVMELKVHDFPVSEIKRIDITVQKTFAVTHGSYSGVVDPIPDSAVQEIIQVKQGDVIYENSTDYKLSSGNVDWSLPGKEPAPGSSYLITYRFRTHVSPEDVDEQGCKIKGAVDGSLVSVDYTWKMPRYDLITIDAKGVVRRIKGIAHPWRPSMPKAPSGQLLLCYIHQTWKKGEEGKIKIVNNAIHAVPMNELEAMKSGIRDLYALFAEERLRSDANSREPTTKKGVFVDPFFDDDMRDQGIVQFAAIVNKELILPIDVEIIDVERGKEPYLLPYELEPVLEQLLQTKEMKINPYQAFDPVPAKVTMNKNIDHWTEVKTVWKSPVTREFTTSEVSELLSSSTKEEEFMREAIQDFEIEGFEPNEKLKEIKFDGISIQPLN